MYCSTYKEQAKLREARNNLSIMLIDDKIYEVNLGYRFAIQEGKLTLARNHLFRAIDLIIDKIESKHCSPC